VIYFGVFSKTVSKTHLLSFLLSHFPFAGPWRNRNLLFLQEHGQVYGAAVTLPRNRYDEGARLNGGRVKEGYEKEGIPVCEGNRHKQI
jgi:hypothetical protein